ncbi:SRPBCC domain-containing protein [Tamlana sp. 2_MG-2023]|uniref:SRPBCC domain-containing protein n=1 Tax=unclassified Tamlana TaxID=2614803 RepID=UPI0026E43144|nr:MULTISPECIES: SRPBCC domain-containing protein [unclassified Tamlana]MDO6761672.1 SRPBCC domain-containing protein [Tamlana sp. 2_MG-2023]MDO6792226.1 SRPBCC domain-containing protein [Tamlana sp. 1_MG-2023]
MCNSQIRIQEFIDAEVEKVWTYYNEPNHIVNWNFADPSWHCSSAENNLSVGGTYKARMEAKDGSFGFDFEAVFTEISKGKSFTYEFGGRTATVEFNDMGGQTEVIITFDPEEENPIEMQQEGWQAILTNFKNYTENH